MSQNRMPTFLASRFGVGRRRRATTLIELLVVVGIIAILLTMLVPSLMRSVQLASNAVCMHNLRQISQGLQLYRVENDGWLPDAKKARRNSTLASSRSSRANQNVWFLKLFPEYLPDLTVLTCPEDPYRFRMKPGRELVDDPDVADYASYGINSFIVTAGQGYLSDLDRHQPTRPLNTILVADLGPDYGFVLPRGNQKAGPKRNASMLAWDDTYDPLVSNPPTPWLTVRHGRGINVATVGGGVESANTEVLMYRPIAIKYASCADGQCTLCKELRMYHYSFADDQLYWWTGPLPAR